MALTAALAAASGAARSAHAQGAVQAFPRPGGVVLVTWLAAPDPAVVGYNVYRRAAGVAADKAELANPQPVTVNSLLDTGPNGSGLPLGQPVTYFVRAVARDAAGNMSEVPGSGEAVVTPQNPTVLPAGSFFFYHIDTANAGTVTVENNVLTIRASGTELWDTHEGQTFLAMPVAGDYQITAQVREQPVNAEPENGDGYAKIAVQIKAGVFRGDPWGAVFTSVERDPAVLFEGRKTYQGGVNNYSQPGSGQLETTYPLWLRLVKQGGTITAFQSSDGNSFTQVGDPQEYGTLPPVTYAGLAVTSHRDGQYTIAKFDIPSIKIERR
jgi:hypothetical protein